MLIMVQLVGLITGVLGVFVLGAPDLFRSWVVWWEAGGRLRVGGLLEAVLGVVLFAAAAQTRWPGFVMVVGGVMVAGGLSAVVAGDRLKAVTRWWMGLPLVALRLWGLATALLGVLLVVSSR